MPITCRKVLSIDRKSGFRSIITDLKGDFGNTSFSPDVIGMTSSLATSGDCELAFKRTDNGDPKGARRGSGCLQWCGPEFENP